MQFSTFPFSITDFSTIVATFHNGVNGFASWKTLHRDDVRIRLVVYSPNYLADHWCSKGHIIFCVEGDMQTELKNGSRHQLKKGMIYTVGDNSDAHKTFSKDGCTLFIVD
ncbi:MAG: DHCW motif cupin fold protein [Chitinophagaceae bacterium]|nr:DHCW motif cupin fold protein [Chitinophagaceae bacterium]